MSSTLGSYCWREVDTIGAEKANEVLVYDLNATDPVFVFTIDTATHLFTDRKECLATVTYSHLI